MTGLARRNSKNCLNLVLEILIIKDWIRHWQRRAEKHLFGAGEKKSLGNTKNMILKGREGQCLSSISTLD